MVPRSPSGLARRLWWLALLAGPVLAAAQVPSTAPDTSAEPVLLELQIGRLARRTVQAYRVRTEALLPLSQLLDLAEVRYRLSPEGRLEARVDPGDRRLIVDAREDSMAFGSHRVRLEHDFRLFRDGDVFVGAERLGDVLGTRIVVNWPDLVVTLVDPSDLPLGRRLRREAERGAFLRRQVGVEPDLDLGAERPSWDGLVLDYSWASPSSAPFDGGAYTAALGADALGGSLELGVRSIGPAGDGRAELEGSWVGVWRERRWLRQLRLGDGVSGGPRGRALRGVAATNAPYLRPSVVGELAYRGRLGPGWSVEAYRGGDFVAYDSSDARGDFTIDLPVSYGENPVTFVAYGPFGEIREFNRTYRVADGLLAAQRFEYAASGGECRTPLCAAMANADVRYGVTRRWTLRAGVDAFWRDSLPDRHHPYASLLGNPTNAWAVELEGVGRGFARAALTYEPSLHLRLGAGAAAFATDTAGALGFPTDGRSQWTVTAFWRPRPGGFAFIDARAERVHRPQGAETRARIGGSWQAAEIRWFPSVRLERTLALGSMRAYGGLDVFVLPRRALGPVLGPIWWRGALETGRSGLTRVSGYASRPLGSALRAEIGLSWTGGAAGPTYSIILTSNLPMLRASTVVTAPPGAPAVATQFVQGSLLWDRASGALTGAPGPSLERAGVAGYVFRDENGNGVRDPGEPGIPHVRVLIGTTRVRTDSRGAYRAWDLVPFEPLLVTVDSLSLRSPLDVPAFATASLVPGPNRFRAFDVPVVRAGVIEGRVERDGRGAAGITLVLTDRRTGARRRVATFSDGGFYALGVKPGDYELGVAASVLEALQATAEPVRFTLAPTAQGVGLEGIVLTLMPKP